MKTSLYSQHEEHTIWLQNLAFYNDELCIMESRLAEITRKNTSKEVLAQVEHFQNQFIMRRRQVDDLRRHIQADEHKIAEQIFCNVIASDRRKAEDHASEREDIKSLEADLEALRGEFKHFAAEWM